MSRACDFAGRVGDAGLIHTRTVRAPLLRSPPREQPRVLEWYLSSDGGSSSDLLPYRVGPEGGLVEMSAQMRAGTTRELSSRDGGDPVR